MRTGTGVRMSFALAHEMGSDRTLTDYGFSVQTNRALLHYELARGAPNIARYANIAKPPFKRSRQFREPTSIGPTPWESSAIMATQS
jgi:hypothetical protein